MELDPRLCHRALRARDARFDGRFFVGVRSTRVFCRPVCPARTPKAENCRFFACAAAAREAGFRPCLRCRPEASPGTPAWLGSSATVSRALRLIGGGALDGGGVADLAERLGVGERHLRRLFEEHLGTSPLSVAQTRRLLFAKKLIDETDLAMSEVAFSSGFSSIRRFNSALRSAYGVPPRELRRRAWRNGTKATATDLSLELGYRPPLDWEALLAFLGDRSTAGVEAVRGRSYRRSIACEGGHGVLEVSLARRAHCLRARVHLPAAGAIIEVAEAWRPWRAYAVMYLWNQAAIQGAKP